MGRESQARKGKVLSQFQLPPGPSGKVELREVEGSERTLSERGFREEGGGVGCSMRVGEAEREVRR